MNDQQPESSKERKNCRRQDLHHVENPPGILRTTLAYNAQMMLCHFKMKKGTKIPLHDHEAAREPGGAKVASFNGWAAAADCRRRCPADGIGCRGTRRNRELRSFQFLVKKASGIF